MKKACFMSSGVILPPGQSQIEKVSQHAEKQTDIMLLARPMLSLFILKLNKYQIHWNGELLLFSGRAKKQIRSGKMSGIDFN